MLSIQLFGECQLTDNGATITALNQTRLQSLLAYLLLHRHAPQSRQQLAFLFWPDSSETQARANLRHLLHDLHQALPNAQHFLHSNSKTIQWHQGARYTLDVAAFEEHLAQAEKAEKTGDQPGVVAALATAVDLYQGDLLPACYDDWILPERERWRERFTAALEKLLLLLEAQRTYDQAISYAQHLLRHDPLHESTYRHLMRLYALHGDRASALRIYQTCVSVLRRELDVEPHPMTDAVYVRLLDGAASPATAAPMLPSTTSKRPTQGMLLVGRPAEWAILQSAWRKVFHGGAHFVLIAGVAGIGKSRLAEEMLQWVDRQGMATARTRSYAAEGDMAYAPVIEWLQSAAIQAALPQLESTWLSEIARLLPQLRLQVPNLPSLPTQTERWQRRQLFEALARAVLLAKPPLLLVLDDLQWSDQETLEWLHYLLRFAQQARLLVIGTARAEEVDEQHPLTTLLLHLRASGQVTEIELGALNVTETATLATQIMGQTLSTEVIKRFYEATEGNPLFVVEMAHASIKQADAQQAFSIPDLPPKVHAVIQTRLHQLSAAARELVGLAATVGRAFSFAILAGAGDQDEATLIRSLDELWQKRIIRQQDANTYDFSHDRIRDVAYAEMSAPRRQFLHKRVAQALVILHSAQDTAIGGQLAFHYEQAQLLEEAMRCYGQAAAASAARYAFQDALVYHERVLTLIDKLPNASSYLQEQIASWLEIAQILIVTHGWTAIERKHALEKAYDLITKFGNKRELYKVLHGLRVYYANVGDWYNCFRYAQEALQAAEEMQDLHSLCLAYQGMGSTYLQLGEFLLSLHHFQKIRDVEVHLESAYQPEISSRARQAEVLWLSGYPEQAQIAAAEAIRLAEEQRHPHGKIHAREFVMYVHQRLGDIPTVNRLSAEITALAEQFGFPNYALAARIILGWAMAQEGAIQSGLQQIVEAIAATEQIVDRFNRPYFLALLAQVQAQNGEAELALQTIAQAQQEVDKSGDQLWQAELLRLTGEFRQLLQEGPEVVAGHYRAALAIARQQGAKSLELRAAMSLARLEQAKSKERQNDATTQRLLAEIYGWFTEGFETADLQAAKELLAALS